MCSSLSQLVANSLPMLVLTPLPRRGTFGNNIFFCEWADMTGRPWDHAMEMDGRSTTPYLARTPRAPLLALILVNLEANRRFRFPRATWDHFRCTVEPSPAGKAELSTTTAAPKCCSIPRRLW